MAGGDDTGVLHGVDRAVRVLRMVAARGTVRLSDVSDELGIALASTHRLLTSLERVGMIARVDGSKLYRTGPALAELATSVTPGRVPDEVLAHIATLAELCGETVHIVALRGRTVEFVAKAESARSTRVPARIGMIMPAHATSGGKALLARYDDEVVGRLYGGAELRPMTGRTLDTLPALLAELARVRRDGYAITDGESEVGLIGVGVAFTDTVALVTGAPRHRVPDSDIPYLASLLERSARDILAELPRDGSWSLGRP